MSFIILILIIELNTGSSKRFKTRYLRSTRSIVDTRIYILLLIGHQLCSKCKLELLLVGLQYLSSFCPGLITRGRTYTNTSRQIAH